MVEGWGKDLIWIIQFVSSYYISRANATLIIRAPVTMWGKPYLKATVDLKLLLEKAGGDFIPHENSRSSWDNVLKQLQKCTRVLISTSFSENDDWLLAKFFWKRLGFWIMLVFRHSRLAVCKTELLRIYRIMQCQGGQSTRDSVRWRGKWSMGWWEGMAKR